MLVYSFYKYKDIKNLLHTKHTHLGYYIYHILAKNSIALFTNEFQLDEKIYSIAIDDHLRESYSHTAILNSYTKSKHITPLNQKLLSTNTISYSGKSKAFRENNSREFQLKDITDKNIILVDDIITTGTTLSQAKKLLENRNNQVFFSLTLADASLK